MLHTGIASSTVLALATYSMCVTKIEPIVFTMTSALMRRRELPVDELPAISSKTTVSFDSLYIGVNERETDSAECVRNSKEC